MIYIKKFKAFEKFINSVNSQTNSVLIIHGYDANNQDCFYPWLAGELRKLSYNVEVPNLPNTSNPNVDDQVNFILKNFPGKKDIIIGHSLGACVAMKLVEKLKYRVDDLVLIAGFNNSDFSDKIDQDEKINLQKSCNWKFNYAKIINNTNHIHILKPNIDSDITNDQTIQLASKLGQTITSFNSEEDHACGLEEPEILKYIKNNIN